MELIFVTVLVAVTSVFGYGIARRFQRLTAGSLMKAIGSLLDWAGLFTLFMAANLTLGFLIVIVFRELTLRFVSLYQLESVLLLILSAAQAFVFCQWHHRA
jgi:hypothetical protein